MDWYFSFCNTKLFISQQRFPFIVPFLSQQQIEDKELKKKPQEVHQAFFMHIMKMAIVKGDKGEPQNTKV